MDRRALGRKGEDLAGIYFENLGYVIADRNFYCRFGEIDLVLRKDACFRFVEVKYRRTMDYGLPQEAVVRRKQQKIRKAALLWLRRRCLPVDREIHFDVLGISEGIKGAIFEYIEDAF
jgi:putative endonuclease